MANLKIDLNGNSYDFDINEYNQIYVEDYEIFLKMMWFLK